MNKKAIFLSILFFMLISVVPVNAAPKVKLNVTKKTMYVADTCALKVTGTNRKVKWSSSNRAVATVNNFGRVYAKKAGNVVIRAKVGGKNLKCRIKVLRVAKGALKYLKGTWESASMSYEGSTYTATFTAKYCRMRILDGSGGKVKIVAITKTSYGYLIRLRGYRGFKYGYRLNMKYPNVLEYVGTWEKNSLEGYSGSSSLSNNGWQS